MLSCVNLHQPWADAIVEGLLPILIRSIPVQKRKIGVAATNWMDGVFFETLSYDDLGIAEERLRFNCVVGSVIVDKCDIINSSDVWDELVNRIGIKDAKFYPDFFIPRTGRVYFWQLSNPIRFSKPLRIARKGITWSQAKEDPKSQTPSKSRSFWKRYNCQRYLELNDFIRITSHEQLSSKDD